MGPPAWMTWLTAWMTEAWEAEAWAITVGCRLGVVTTCVCVESKGWIGVVVVLGVVAVSVDGAAGLDTGCGRVIG